MVENTKADYEFDHQRANNILSKNKASLLDEMKKDIAIRLNNSLVDLPGIAGELGEDIFFERKGYNKVLPLKTMSDKYDLSLTKELACVALVAEQIYNLLSDDAKLQKRFDVIDRSEGEVFYVILSNLIQGVNSYQEDDHLDNLVGCAQDIFGEEF